MAASRSPYVSSEVPGSSRFEQQRSPLGVRIQQPHRASSIPERQRVPFVLCFFIEEADFQHNAAPIRPDSRSHERDAAALKRRTNLGERPTFAKLVDQTRQSSQPGAAGIAVRRQLHAHHGFGNLHGNSGSRPPALIYALYVPDDTRPPRPVQFVWKNWPRGLSMRS